MSGEKFQDLNRRLSQAGLPAAVLDEETEELSGRIAEAARDADIALERNSSLFGQAWAAAAFVDLLEYWDGLGAIPGVEIPEDISRLHSEPDQSTLWVLVHGDISRERVAIEHLGQYRQVAEKRLTHIQFCQAGISIKCEGRRRLTGRPNVVEPYEGVYFGIKLGMYILTTKMCSVCRNFLRNCGPVEDMNEQVQYSLGTAETGCTQGGDQPDLLRGWYYTVDGATEELLMLPYPETAIHRGDPLKAERQRQEHQRWVDHLRARGLVDDEGNSTGLEMPDDLWDDYPND